MSLVLILLGAVLVAVALFNKVPSYVPGRFPTARTGHGARAGRGGSVATAQHSGVRPRVRLVSAKLTEQGQALLTTLGGSALIVAFFLNLSGL
ncbi:hypothetical protein [Nocardiopsis halotolerans]|uniref:hypothetical protein n=1 Tax=Nocardiopsis halotolerans TaxID=124252 RepID=UPI000349740D|nr:hypothetical protein [Nocardiopsis halotolerans]